MPFTTDQLIAEAVAEGRRDAIRLARRLLSALKQHAEAKPDNNYSLGFKRGIAQCLTLLHLNLRLDEVEKAETEQPAVVAPMCPACKEPLTALARFHGRTVWGHRMSDKCQCQDVAISNEERKENDNEAKPFDSLGDALDATL